ncbi:MAG: hypothetical protein WCD18_12285 [Thermosynechococcaceae cyanobacterium]
MNRAIALTSQSVVPHGHGLYETGVLLFLDLQPQSIVRSRLFEEPDDGRSQPLMTTVDNLNHKKGAVSPYLMYEENPSLNEHLKAILETSNETLLSALDSLIQSIKFRLTLGCDRTQCLNRGKERG